MQRMPEVMLTEEPELQRTTLGEALSHLVLSNPHQPNHLPDIFYLLQMPQAVQENIGLRRS